MSVLFDVLHNVQRIYTPCSLTIAPLAFVGPRVQRSSGSTGSQSQVLETKLGCAAANEKATKPQNLERQSNPHLSGCFWPVINGRCSPFSVSLLLGVHHSSTLS